MNDVWRARPRRPSNSNVGVLGEDLAVRPEPDAGAGLVLGDPAALAGQPGLRREARVRAVGGEHAGHAALEADALLGRRAVDVDVHPRRQRVDDREADAVQAARGDVGAAAELAAGVQLGGDHLDAGEPGLGLLVGRDAAAVVVHLGRAVGVQRDLDAVRGARQRLVDAVVDDLPQAVHEPAGVGRADVHARPLAHRLEPLEDEEVCGVVGVVGDRRAPAVVRRSRWCPQTYLRHADDAAQRTPVQTGRDTPSGVRGVCDQRKHDAATVAGITNTERSVRIRHSAHGSGGTKGRLVPGGTPIRGWAFRRMRISKTNAVHVLGEVFWVLPMRGIVDPVGTLTRHR